ncbi:hypothetical protein [Bacillus paralicheniformis]|nr:hypothetical protein [Bacillus paralicheniformis]
MEYNSYMNEQSQYPAWSYPYNLIIWKAFVGHDVKSYLYGL